MDKKLPASSKIMCIEIEKKNACKAEKKCYHCTHKMVLTTTGRRRREYALTIRITYVYTLCITQSNESSVKTTSPNNENKCIHRERDTKKIRKSKIFPWIIFAFVFDFQHINSQCIRWCSFHKHMFWCVQCCWIGNMRQPLTPSTYFVQNIDDILSSFLFCYIFIVSPLFFFLQTKLFMISCWLCLFGPLHSFEFKCDMFLAKYWTVNQNWIRIIEHKSKFKCLSKSKLS